MGETMVDTAGRFRAELSVKMGRCGRSWMVVGRLPMTLNQLVPGSSPGGGTAFVTFATRQRRQRRRHDPRFSGLPLGSLPSCNLLAEKKAVHDSLRTGAEVAASPMRGAWRPRSRVSLLTFGRRADAEPRTFMTFPRQTSSLSRRRSVL